MRPQLLKRAIVVAGFAVLGSSSGAALAADPDWKAVEQALGKPGQLQAGDVFRVGMPRTDLSVTVKSVAVKAGFRLGSYAAFRQGGSHHGADFVLLDKEVNAVARTLLQQGIDVTAIHNHGRMDTPRLFYMHFWANDDPAKLAQGLKAALDHTNSAKP